MRLCRIISGIPSTGGIGMNNCRATEEELQECKYCPYNVTAWSFMPKKMLDYIKALPEFDAEIFYKITGIDCR